MAQECAAVGEWRVRSEEGEPASIVQLDKPGQEEASEQLAQNPHRQEEGWPRRCVLRREPCRRRARSCARAGDRSAPSPSVEHGSDADTGTEALRIGGDGQHGLRRRAEQQVVERGLVVEGDDGDLGRHGEDDMEVADMV